MSPHSTYQGVRPSYMACLAKAKAVKVSWSYVEIIALQLGPSEPMVLNSCGHPSKTRPMPGRSGNRWTLVVTRILPTYRGRHERVPAILVVN